MQGEFVLDFAVWLEHWASHHITLLWRIHRMHHADNGFDFTTGMGGTRVEFGTGFQADISDNAEVWTQLKGAYGLSWFSAAWRTLFLLMFCSFAITLFILAIIMLGLTG